MFGRFFFHLPPILAIASTALPPSSASAEEGEKVLELDDRIVFASPIAQSKEDLVAPASELGPRALQRNSQKTLGDTLDAMAGVHSSSFTAGSGRPIIRGFDGDRIRILNQGTDTFDVSFTSPDHGVSVEPFFAEEIEVIRGPASLLYGNAAIGGAVNVIDNALPARPSAAPLSGNLKASYSSAADEITYGVSLLGGASRFAWSLGFHERSAADYAIPGFAASPYLEGEGEHGEEHEYHGHGEPGHHSASEDENPFGVAPNSFVENQSGHFGMSWFGDNSSLGGSYSRYTSSYGVPGHSHHEEGHQDEQDGKEHEEHEERGEREEPVSIDLRQSRLKLRGEVVEPNEFFQSIEANFGYGDYRHSELEGETVGTVFESHGYELRLTGVHRPIGPLTGAVGFHLKDQSLQTFGEEAFIPSNSTASHGLFAVERLGGEWGTWEFGGRVESVKVDPDPETLPSADFVTATLSSGWILPLGDAAQLSSNVTYAERAPNASELFAFGPHPGTQSFEIGDSGLGKEQSLNLDVSFRRHYGFATGQLNLFVSQSDGYVYLRKLKEDELRQRFGELDTDGLDAFLATAVDARFYGYELDLRFHFIDKADRRLHFDFLLDETRASNRTFDTQLPRIPVRRIGGRWEHESGPWLLALEGRYHFEAGRLAPGEMPTDSYLLWGVEARYRISMAEGSEIDIFLRGSNLGDTEARPHTSFTKNLQPLPGRSLEVGIRSQF